MPNILYRELLCDIPEDEYCQIAEIVEEEPLKLVTLVISGKQVKMLAKDIFLIEEADDVSP